MSNTRASTKAVKVFVGMSGGVDSSVTAALLKQQGYSVTGVYMKNWSKDLPGYPCPWKEDYQDAKRVAVQLGIDFKMFDFEKNYFDKVVKYMLDGFKAGITPNPDIMCNQEIKFKLFLDVALEQGADMIATGHYARLKRLDASQIDSAKPILLRSSWRSAVSEPPVLNHRTNAYGSLRASVHPSSSSKPDTSEQMRMFSAKDANKDQTYFLYRVNKDALSKTLFPLGEYTKPEVRSLAKKIGLATATKKESMGICFVGKVGIKEFLQQYVSTMPGPVIDGKGVTVGEHDGAIYYTTGQRHGLNVGGGLPYYVVGKDMKKNEVYVTTDLSDAKLWSDTIRLNNCHWINQAPKINKKYYVRTRHRAPLVAANVTDLSNQKATLKLDDPIRALTPGQSAVLYDGELVLGGGIMV